MALEEYKQKRNFRITSEPKGKVERSKGDPIFVIQEHHATRLHYDFRLEADGVLKSWAVTKEPTLDPKIKRLAVEVEDHPLSYANFSGDIPEGEYGAGHVEIWDRGKYRNVMEEKPEALSVSEAIEKGHLEVELFGEKLRGKFALIKMKGRGEKDWLLIKMKDGEARPGSAPKEDGAATKRGATSRGRNGTATTGKRTASKKAATKARSTGATRNAPPEEVELTSPGKIMFPEPGYTKKDLFTFYDRIADHLLPHLAERPMTLERLPDGLSGPKAPHFWQKDTPEHYPDWIPRVELESERGEPVNYVLVNDRETLLYLVNLGTVTFHPWLSRIGSLDTPDYVLFDLDPGPGGFASAIQVARELRDVLADAGVDPVVKTSGKRGIHLLAPWKEKSGYEEAREWALGVAEQVIAQMPKLVTVERSKAKRGGKLYLDVMQNARGHHAVPPYVLRATPDATVSTPLRWNELTDALTPEKFNLKTIFRRLSRMKDDPAEVVVHWR